MCVVLFLAFSRILLAKNNYWLHVQINKTAFEFFQCRPHFFFLSIKLLIAVGLCPRAEKGRRERRETENENHFGSERTPLSHFTTTKMKEEVREKVLIFIFFKCGKVHDEKITFNPFQDTKKEEEEIQKKRLQKNIFPSPISLPPFSRSACWRLPKKMPKMSSSYPPKKGFFLKKNHILCVTFRVSHLDGDIFFLLLRRRENQDFPYFPSPSSVKERYRTFAPHFYIHNIFPANRRTALSPKTEVFPYGWW